MEKIIIVPKDSVAMRELDINQEDSNQLYQLILDDSNFKMLWDTGIFSYINSLAGSLIDLYEDEKIINHEMLGTILKSQFFDEITTDQNTKELVFKLKSLIKKAYDLRTGIFFYF